jgi:hypothetical protein
MVAIGAFLVVVLFLHACTSKSESRNPSDSSNESSALSGRGTESMFWSIDCFLGDRSLHMKKSHDQYLLAIQLTDEFVCVRREMNTPGARLITSYSYEATEPVLEYYSGWKKLLEPVWGYCNERGVGRKTMPEPILDLVNTAILSTILQVPFPAQF